MFLASAVKMWGNPARAVGGKHIFPPSKKGTLPETNIAHKNPPSKMVFTRKDGDFHGLC